MDGEAVDTDTADDNTTTTTTKQRSSSQRDFVPTPYRPSVWEIVGEACPVRDFAPLELDIIQSQLAQFDPMFEQFDTEHSSGLSRAWHRPDGPFESTPQTDTITQPEGVLIPEEELARQLQERYDAGVAAGRAEAEKEIAAQQAQLRAQLEELMQNIGNESKELFIRIEKEAVKLALQVAKKILVTTAELKPEYIVTVIHEAVTSLGAGKAVRIRLAPQDLEFVQVIGLPPELSAHELGVTYVADEGIRSGCVVETEFGEIDLQLETMWEQVKERLYEVYK